MYADQNFQVIQDAEVYVAPDGTQYPYSFPKDEIPGLNKVTETAAPVDANSVVTGFIIDETFTQVWQTRQKTTDELNNDLRAKIDNLESLQTPRRVREAIAGVDNGWLAKLDAQISTLRTQFKK